MAPVVRLAQLPKMKPSGKQRSVYPCRKLLHPSVQVEAPRSAWRCLDNADPGVHLHHLHQSGQAFAAHDTIGIQHHHITIERPPAAAKIVEITALAFDSTLSAAIENLTESIQITTQHQPGIGFLNGSIGIGRIAQNKDVEMPVIARTAQGFQGGAHPSKDSGNILVTDWHQ